MERGSVPPEKSAREQAMEAMVQGRVKEFADTYGMPVEDLTFDPDADPHLADEAAEHKEVLKQEDEQLTKQLTADGPLTIDDPTKYVVRVKVDGEERVESLQDVLRVHQKEQAANKRLEEATRLLKEAQSGKPPAAETPAPPKQAADWGERKKKFLTALYSGDEEKTAAALDDIFQAGTQQQAATPPVDISVAVKQELRRNAVESALGKFQSDNADIVNDPYLVVIANQILASETQGVPLEELPDHRIEKALADTASKTRDWARAKAAAFAPKAEPTTRQDRARRKESIDEIPSINATATSAEERPMTNSDIIAEMRKARGLSI